VCELFIRANHRALVGLFTISVLLYGGACGDDQTCVEALGPACDPLYEPVFEQVFNRTLKPGCAVEGNACHSGSTAKAGLRMDDIDMSYELLVPGGRVIPGDPGCSLLSTRLAGQNGGVMPPGDPLSEAERCAIETWIANGAQR
jgi:hypothetical protein